MDNDAQHRTFDEWLAQHRSLLFKVLRAYAFTPHDQDDLFQEITTQIFKSIPRYRGDCGVTTWLYRVALNTALAWSRKELRRRDRTEALNGADTALITPARQPDKRLDWLYEQIALLDHVDRSLTLLLLDGFSYREMAETLGITESHVGVKISRIKAHLVNQAREEHSRGL